MNNSKTFGKWQSSTDQTALDIELPFMVGGVSNNVMTVIGTMLITIYVTPQVLFLAIPLGYLFIKLQVASSVLARHSWTI